MASFFNGKRIDTVTQTGLSIERKYYNDRLIFKKRIKSGTVLMDDLYQCQYVPSYMGNANPKVTAAYGLMVPEKFDDLDKGIEIKFGEVSDNVSTGFIVCNDLDYSRIAVSSTQGYEKYNHVIITKQQLMSNAEVVFKIPGYTSNLLRNAAYKFIPDYSKNYISFTSISGDYSKQMMAPIIKSVIAL